MKKKVLSIILALVMVVGIVPFGAITAFAAEGVKYLEYNTETGVFDERTCTEYTPLADGVTTWSGGWYVAPAGKLELGDVNVNGSAYLILTDGCELIVNGGIHINNGSSFTIYAQSEGENAGVLVANGGQYSAGIGSIWWGSCGDITINGGNVTATGGERGAGIGNGSNGSCGNITINGGKVTAKGGNPDQSGYAGAGIGNAYYGSCGDITINGGEITAIGCDSFADVGCYGGNGIGNADEGVTCGKITINGGYITAVGGKASAENAICGKPYDAEVVLGEHISVFDRVNEKMIVTDNTGEKNYCDTFNSLAVKDKNGRPVSIIFALENELPDNAIKYYEFYDEFGIVIANYKYIDFDSASSITSETRSLTSGWYKVDGEVTIEATLAVTGDVHLMLNDGCKLTVSYGVLLEKENSLSVYAGTKGDGQLIAKQKYNNSGAGIGGYYSDAGDLTVYGGNITAKGGDFSAGIGGGQDGAGGTVNIFGGSVTATSGVEGAGIGGGNKGNGGTVTVYGGSVTATGGENGAGIGGGHHGNDGTVTVYGGSVTATGGFGSAGIGGGYFGNGGTVTVYGGNINAVGGDMAAGIGGGADSSGATINISGGSVIAVGGEGCSAVGPGVKIYTTGTQNSGEIAPFANAILYNGRDGSVINGKPYYPGNYDSYIGPVNDTAVKDEQGRNTVCFYAISDVSKQTHCLAYNTSTKKFEDKSVDESKVFGIFGSTTWDLQWYEVDGNEVIDSKITVNGDVNLILKDGCKLEANGGITVTEGGSLTVYGQTKGTGELIAKSTDIHYAAIEVGEGAAMTVHGGKITATGGSVAAGIGGGYESNGGNIAVYGGAVIAVSGQNAGGIGGGSGCTSHGELTLTDDLIIIVGDTSDNSRFVTAAEYKERRYNYVFMHLHNFTGGTCAYCGKGPITYIDHSWDETKKQVITTEKAILDDAPKITADTTALSEIWYVADGEVTVTEKITVSGNVNLILKDGCSLMLNKGLQIYKNGSLTIYGQAEGTGTLETPQLSDNLPAIGVGETTALTVHGGNIYAYGGKEAAGIGGYEAGSYNRHCGTVTVYGGNIYAQGGQNAAGIGGAASYGYGGILTVYGGNIIAKGGHWGAGIGGNQLGSKGVLNVYNNCYIRAEGEDYGICSEINLYPDRTGSTEPKIRITGDGTDIDGSPFAGKTEISEPISADTVCIMPSEMSWTSTTALPIYDGYYVLENDVTLSSGWDFPGKTKITLDLNGHKISRNLTEATENGYVISTSGNLTVLDSSTGKTGTITGGKNSGSGGGIFVGGGTLTMNDVSLSGNSAINGGGIYVEQNTAAKLNLTDCKIENNTVSERGSGFCLNSGNAALTNCQIKNNRSEYYGGGFFVDFTASVSLNGCTVSGNSAKNGGGAFEMEKDGCVLVVENSSITVNSVDNESGGIKKGGGIHFYKGSVTFKGNVTVKDNTCAGAINNICMRGNTVTFDASELSKDSAVYVNDGVLNDISGITNENVDALIMENGNHIVLNNGNLTSHTPDYTGNYVDNGDGTHSRKCTGCDKYSEVKFAHTVTAYVSDNNATCTEDGTKTGTCDACGAVVTVTDEGTIKGHDFTGDYVDNGDGTHSRKCTRCDEHAEEKEAHIITYVSDNNATCTEDGTKSGQCEICGLKDTVTDVGTKKGHDFTGDYVGNINGTHSRKCTRCDELSAPEVHSFTNGVCACGEKDMSGKYILRSWDGDNKKVVTQIADIPSNTVEIKKDTTELNGGWYVVSKNTENKNRIVVKGTTQNPTNIVLFDGFKLDAKAGIEVAEGYVLNIFTQNQDTGEITADLSTGIYYNYHNAAIGGSQNKGGGTITVNGGTVTVTSVGGAGIGGGSDGHGGTITINGGTVIAKTYNGGAGIGGGYRGSSGTITINGGTVKAYTNNDGNGAAAIGSGYGSDDSGTITINGGNITAMGGSDAAGIGGGHYGSGGTIAINGGTVTAVSPDEAGIGGGYKCENHGTLTVVDGLTVKAGENADNAEPVTAEDYRTNRNHYVKIYNKHGEQFVKCAVNVAGGTLINCTVTLTGTENAENVYNGVIDGENTYYVDNIANGTYLLTVASDGTVTRTYTVEIDGGAVEKSAELYAEGDVNGDGVVDVNDYSAAVNTALGSETEVKKDLAKTDEYQKAVADFDKDGFVDVIDLVLFERVVSC